MDGKKLHPQTSALLGRRLYEEALLPSTIFDYPRRGGRGESLTPDHNPQLSQRRRLWEEVEHPQPLSSFRGEECKGMFNSQTLSSSRLEENIVGWSLTPFCNLPLLEREFLGGLLVTPTINLHSSLWESEVLWKEVTKPFSLDFPSNWEEALWRREILPLSLFFSLQAEDCQHKVTQRH